MLRFRNGMICSSEVSSGGNTGRASHDLSFDGRESNCYDLDEREVQVNWK